MQNCLSCSAPIPNHKRYCNNACQSQHKHSVYITEWLAGNRSGQKYEGEVSGHIRTYLHQQSGSKCIKCGWGEVNPVTGRVPLTVNHIDGNSSNHRPENLELICPNCHSLTPNYGSLNRGKGRTKRKSTAAPIRGQKSSEL